MKGLLFAAIVLLESAAFAEESKSKEMTSDSWQYKQAGFELKGKLENVQGNMVTIDREGLPSAVLDVRSDTKVMLDGRQISAATLPEGSSVRAKFQVEGEKIVALEIHATSAKKKTPSTEPKPQKY